MLLAGVATVNAQTVGKHGQSKSLMGIEVHFPFDKADLDLNYMGNAASLERFAHVINTIGCHRIDSVVIISQSSPEGAYLHNMKLSQHRAVTMRHAIESRHPQLAGRLYVHPDGESWKRLRDYVASDTLMKQKTIEQVLSVIDADVNIDTKKWRMEQLPVYRYLRNTYYPRIRNSVFCIIYFDTLFEVARIEDVVNLDGTDVSNMVLPPVALTRHTPQKPFYMGIKTNALYDLLLVPNIGMELYLGRGYTVAANWAYAWWNSDRAKWYWRVYGGDIAVRKWLGRRAKAKPLTGHHIGLYAQALTYDFLWNGKGSMGGDPGGDIFDRATLGMGAEYGYSLPVADRLNLDFTLGVGYIYGQYHEYTSVDDCYVWQTTKMRHYIGPTKAEVSLVWLIGRGNVNAWKGGRR